ncbi:MAG TPA: hypothetical protein VM409_04440, partial [Chloroflexia bacterium]|nr:hypothetical protein [Chloroflexia bacterium]
MHSPGYDDMSERLLEALNLIKEKTTFRFGLATVENARHEVALVQAVTSSQMPALEETLLEKARALMPRLLFDEADVLVVAEIGKNISGTGMDPNVTGRPSTGNSDFRAGKVVVLALTPAAGGNALGIGFADVTTERLVRGIDLAETWINAATSTNLPAARIPIFTPNDRTALQLALKTCGKPDPSQAHVAWIRNTLELESIYVSEALWAQLDGKADIEQTGNPEEVPFDTAGNILWPGLHWAF